VRQLINPYGVSKLFIEHALKAYDRAYGLRFRKPALLQCCWGRVESEGSGVQIVLINLNRATERLIRVSANPDFVSSLSFAVPISACKLLPRLV